MHTITLVLFMLLAVVVSAFLARLSPVRIPLPLIQIAVGALISYETSYDVVLDPEIFFLLFIPPLLFLDGWRIPKGAFFRDLRPIMTLAIGLVMFTVVGIGFLIDWMIPVIPLAVAFALAAILSPTDPVAVAAVSTGTRMPPRLMHILEGESLLNDASGLVCFRFAVAAALTGTFSFAGASLSFVLVAGGGVIIGILVAWAIAQANKFLLRHSGEEPGVQVLISLLIPFTAYLAAEQVQASGILAAATAGITMHYADLNDRGLGSTRMQRRVVWDTVQLALNGIIFVLLGLQLPAIIQDAPAIAQQAGVSSAWYLLAYVVVITLALTAARFVWVWVSLRLTLFRARKDDTRQARSSGFLLRVPLLAAFAGVRGAITLAGILTLPLTMTDGSAFPARDLVIALAMGVILMSLLMGVIAIPLLSGSIEFAPEPSGIGEEPDARSLIAEAAIRRIEQVCTESSECGVLAHAYPEAATHVIDLYRRRLDYGHADDEAKQSREAADAERRLRIEALRAERDALYRMRISRQIDDTLHQKLVHEIDLIEAALAER